MKRPSKILAQPGTQAVSRAIAILKALAAAEHAFGLGEIAAEVGVNKPAVFRLLGALDAEGMVVRDDATGGYRLGPELIKLGSAAIGSTDLSAAARPELLDIMHETGETATLEVLIGTEILIIAEVQGRKLLGTTPELGMRWPAHATSTGKLLLALSDPAPVVGQLTKRTPKTIVSRVTLERELEDVRKRGYATASDELEVGFTAIAAPVCNHFGKVVAALSINGPTARLTPAAIRAMAATLCSAADRVSLKLGASQAMLHTVPALRKPKPTLSERATAKRRPLTTTSTP